MESQLSCNRTFDVATEAELSSTNEWRGDAATAAATINQRAPEIRILVTSWKCPLDVSQRNLDNDGSF